MDHIERNPAGQKPHREPQLGAVFHALRPRGRVAGTPPPTPRKMDSDLLPISSTEAELLERLSPEKRADMLRAREKARGIVANADLGSRAAVSLIILDVAGAGLPILAVSAAEHFENVGPPPLSLFRTDALERLPTRAELAHLLACEYPSVRTAALRISGRVLGT